jgi:RNA polymerase sigma-70 factor (ECF subfamily)
MHDRNHDSPSESQLIRRAAAGDQRAFAGLLRLHERRVFALALRFTGSSDEAQDIYQEVFMRVYTALPDFRGRSEFSTWVHRITVNVCMTHLESRRRHGHAPPLDREQSREAPTPEGREGATPETQLLDTERRERVHEALLALPPQQRLVFTLRHHEGYRLREIAVMIGCRIGTVKRYLFEATRTMRERLNDLV